MPDIGMRNIEGTPRRYTTPRHLLPVGTYCPWARLWLCGRYSRIRIRIRISSSDRPPIRPLGKNTGVREEAASETMRPSGVPEAMPPDGRQSKQHLSRPSPAMRFAIRDDDAVPVAPAFLCSALSNKSRVSLK